MISIKKYKKNYNKIWDNFIKNSNNGTIFHTQKFLSYHKDRLFNDHSLLFYNKHDLVAVLPAAKITKNEITTLYSHPGASYGGLITSQQLRLESLNNIIIALNKYCHRRNFDRLTMILTPSIYLKNRHDLQEYALIWNQFKQQESYISHATNLYNASCPLSKLDKRKKRYIQKLNTENTFVIKNSRDIDVFYPILVASKNEFGIKPTHSKQELIRLMKIFPKNIVLQLSYKNGVVAGGSLTFIANDKSSLVFYNVVKKEYKKSQLSSLQLYFCMQLTINQKLDYIDFGVSHLPKEDNPLTPKFSLINFKEQFGAYGIMRKIYQKDFGA